MATGVQHQELELEGVTNFRDVGKAINDFLGRRQLREGNFYRSARLGKPAMIPSEALPNDAQRMLPIKIGD